MTLIDCSPRYTRMLLMAVCLALVSGQAHAEAGAVSGDKGTDMVVDLVVMRPLGLAATVIGAVGFVVSLPFTIAGGNVGEVAQELVARPAAYTFTRPLGDFQGCEEAGSSCGGR